MNVGELPAPPALVTVIGPLVAPEGTGAVIALFDWTTNEADAPLNDTLEVRRKLTPMIVIVCPTGAWLGESA